MSERRGGKRKKVKNRGRPARRPTLKIGVTPHLLVHEAVVLPAVDLAHVGGLLRQGKGEPDGSGLAPHATRFNLFFASVPCSPRTEARVPRARTHTHTRMHTSRVSSAPRWAPPLHPLLASLPFSHRAKVAAVADGVAGEVAAVLAQNLPLKVGAGHSCRGGGRTERPVSGSATGRKREKREKRRGEREATRPAHMGEAQRDNATRAAQRFSTALPA